VTDESRDHPFGRRQPRKRANGAVPEGMATQPVPMDEVLEPVDLVAVQADDELINALAAGFSVSSPGVGGYDADDHVAAMLAAWKADIDAEPIPEIDLDAAVGAALAGRRPSGRMRHLVPLAGAAALIVVAITGVSIAAHDTRPGDALFPISKVLYAEEARSYESLATVDESRKKARAALAVGDKAAAEEALATGEAAAAGVLAEHGRGEAEQELHRLEVVVEGSEQGVPAVVDDEGDPSSGGTDTAEQPATTTSSPSPSSDPSQGADSDPSQGADSDPTGPSDGGEPGTGTPGGGEPDPTTEPDPRAAPEPPASDSAEPGPGSTEPDPSPPPQEPSDAGPPPTSEPSAAGLSDAGSPPASEPNAGAPAASPTAGSAGPATTSSPDPAPAEGGQPGTGISGATMTATGTATPSGEPST
jgi:hypothetical protein